MSEEIIAQVWLRADNRSTGFTRHEVNGQLLEPPVSLRLVQLDGGPGVYLYYCDSSGEEVTDTWHNNVEAALLQALLEFGVARDDWSVQPEWRTAFDAVSNAQPE